MDGCGLGFEQLKAKDMNIKFNNGKELNTKYNIGDKVFVCKIDLVQHQDGTCTKEKTIETGMFYTKERDERGFVKKEEHPMVYTVMDIEISVFDMKATYKLRNNLLNTTTAYSTKSVTEDMIYGKAE